MSDIFDFVTEKLKSIYDKKSNNNILDLKIIDGLHVDNTGHVKISLKVPLGEERAFDALKKRIQDVLMDLDEVTEVSVFFVRDKSSPEAARIQLSNVKNIILIGSGKGGVGKSTVATNLSCAMAQAGHKVGLLDADIYGPSIPVMLRSVSNPETNDAGKILPLSSYGVKNISIGHMLPDNNAAIWRGPMIQKALFQMLRDTDWDQLDYLFIDLPPGTGDIQLSLSQKLKITGAILVTTPQDVALLDVKKSAEMFEKTAIPLLGLVENMSTFICPHCQETTDIFHTGGGLAVAEAMQIPVLGHIPLDIAVRIGGDNGQPISTQPHSIADIYAKIAGHLHARLVQRQISQIN